MPVAWLCPLGNRRKLVMVILSPIFIRLPTPCNSLLVPQYRCFTKHVWINHYPYGNKIIIGLIFEHTGYRWSKQIYRTKYTTSCLHGFNCNQQISLANIKLFLGANFKSYHWVGWKVHWFLYWETNPISKISTPFPDLSAWEEDDMFSKENDWGLKSLEILGCRNLVSKNTVM